MMLNTHPQVALFTEAGIDNVAAKFLELFKIGHRIIRKNNGEFHQFPIQDRLEDLKDFIKAFYECRFGKEDLKIIGDKVPNVRHELWEQYTGLIGPCLRIIIIRRPDRVVASSLDMRERVARGEKKKWHIRTVEEAVTEWALNWEYAASIFHRDDVLCLSYDRFEDSPDGQIQNTAAFLGVDAGRFDVDFRPTEPNYRLSAADEAIIDALLGDVQARCLDDMNDALKTMPRIVIPISLSRRIVICDRHPITQLLLKGGFGALEPWGVWTIASEATIAFRIATRTTGKVFVSLEFGVFFGDRDTFKVVLSSGGSTHSEFDFKASKENMLNAADSDIFTAGLVCVPDDEGVVTIDIFIPSPKAAGEAPFDDQRQIGLGLYAMHAVGLETAADDRSRVADKDRVVEALLAPEVPSPVLRQHEEGAEAIAPGPADQTVGSL